MTSLSPAASYTPPTGEAHRLPVEGAAVDAARARLAALGSGGDASTPEVRLRRSRTTDPGSSKRRAW